MAKQHCLKIFKCLNVDLQIFSLKNPRNMADLQSSGKPAGSPSNAAHQVVNRKQNVTDISSQSSSGEKTLVRGPCVLSVP